jgi:hypothetical protein
LAFSHNSLAVGDSQARCDSIQADFRAQSDVRKPLRRDPPARPKALEPTEDPLLLRLAEELEYARRMLDIMGNELSSDGLIVSRHLVALQSVDVIGQMLGHIADVVRSSDPRGAVERIGMGELKARLTRRSVF